MPLKITRRHGSPYWYLRGSVRGLRVDESTGVIDERQADEIRITREAELLKRSIHGDSAVRTFAEAAVSYLEAGGDGQHLPPVLKHFGPRKLLTAVDQDAIDDAAKKLLPRASGSTRNRQVYTPISAVLHHAARRRWIGKPVIARPEQPKGRVRWITYAEAERLIEAASPHMRPLVIFLLSTGARLSEALYLDWRQVDLSACQVVFLDTKNSEHRGVSLHPRAVAALANLKHRKGAVFRTQKGDAYEVRVGGGGQISTGWAGMCKRAGISNFTPHDCRHTWATWHYKANKDIPQLMALGGWKSVAMVMRYAHVNTEHLAGSIGKLWPTSGTEGESLPENSPRSTGTF